MRIPESVLCNTTTRGLTVQHLRQGDSSIRLKTRALTERCRAVANTLKQCQGVSELEACAACRPLGRPPVRSASAAL